MTEQQAATVDLAAGYRHVSLGSVGSTNNEAMRLALAGDPGRVWVSATEQVKGRGRSGRSWASVPGNLYASLLLRLACPPQTAQQLSLVAGVAVATGISDLWSHTLRAAGPSDHTAVSDLRSDTVAALRLKWPNDILFGTAKLGGILVESSSGAGGAGLAAVIGIGLNVAGVPDGLDRAATSLAALGIATDRSCVLTALSHAMDRTLTIWDEGRGFAQVREAWLERAGPIGEPLTVNAGESAVAGRFAGLDVDGALLLDDALGVRRRFTYGDVTLAATGSGQ